MRIGYARVSTPARIWTYRRMLSKKLYAKLAHKGGAKLDQIQLSLGQALLMTTERYLGVRHDLHDASCDYLKLDLSSAE